MALGNALDSVGADRAQGDMSMVGRVRTAVCGAGFLVLSGCGPDWTTLQRSDGGFVVAMPGVPLCGPLHREKTSKGSLVGRSCEVNGYRAYYSVSWYDLPAGLGSEDSVVALRELQGRERSSRSVPAVQVTMNEQPSVLGGEPGFEYKGVAHFKNDELSFWDRTCIHKARVFRISVEGGSLDAASDRAWMRMLDSFRFASEKSGGK